MRRFIGIILLLCVGAGILLRPLLVTKAETILDAPKPYNDTALAVKGVQPPVAVVPSPAAPLPKDVK